MQFPSDRGADEIVQIFVQEIWDCHKDGRLCRRAGGFSGSVLIGDLRPIVRVVANLGCYPEIPLEQTLCYTFTMKYKFTCTQCNTEEEAEMSIAEYSEYNAKCKKCKGPQERVYEAPQFKGAGDGADDSASCPSGSCSSCPGC